jgi:cytochrome c-type biogenesis protein
MLIPIALKTGDAIFVPAVFALATAFPVVLISLVITKGVNRVSGMMITV